MKKVIVLAGSYSEFVKYVSGVTFADRDNVIYADTPTKIAGVEAERVDIVGTFWGREDAGRMKELAESRVLRNYQRNIMGLNK